jgi:hypothetical protein
MIRPMAHPFQPRVQFLRGDYGRKTSALLLPDRGRKDPGPPPVEVVDVEFVNGGFGIKNPVLRSGLPQLDVEPSPLPSGDPNTFLCRICGKVR